MELLWLSDQPKCGGFWRVQGNVRSVDIDCGPSYLSSDFASRTVFWALSVFDLFKPGLT
jgi:hypothetical protein